MRAAGAVTISIVSALASHALAAVEDDLRDGDKFFDAGDYKRAAAAYDRAIAKAPGQVAAEAYGKRAAIYIILDDYAGGLAFITRAKARHPGAPEILEQEALLLWETDRKDEAVALAEQVVTRRPSAFTNHKLIGEYYAARDPAKTAAALEGYLAHRPAELEGGDVLPRVRLGYAYLATARTALADDDDARAQQLYTRAADQFELVARKHGKKPNAQVNADNGLCAAYTGLGRWDPAISMCERVVQDPRRIDATGAVWFNLARAYLARRQTKKARTAATEFVRMRKTEARAHMLLGDTYFADREYPAALEHYLRAEKTLRGNQGREQVELSIQLGKTYRRLPARAGTTKNLDLAIEKLAAAHGAHPRRIELAVELGGAYLEARQDAKASALADRLLASADIAQAHHRAALLVLAGKALFNQSQLAEARQRFEAARELRPTDIQIQRQLVTTINEQAYAAGDDKKATQALLEQALAIDAASPVTVTNLAIVAIARGDCAAAQRQLARLEAIRGSDAVVTSRLLARTHLCISRPDPRKASEAYATAEREAKKASAQLALAEVYTEWAPLLWQTDLAGAVEKLEQAAMIAASSADIAPAAKRNLALALYRRGWKHMRDGKAGDAAVDFERALRDPAVLKGNEEQLLELSLAFALVDNGRAADAAKTLRGMTKGSLAGLLAPPYSKVGLPLLTAYATYRSATGAARQQACSELSRLDAELGGRARELVAGCWESVAHDQWRAGQLTAAHKSLALAERTATADQKRRIELDRAVLALGKDKLATLEAMGGTPPEALINLGIVYDLLGKPREAYDAWTRAKARGVTTRDLQRWIDAKKRIYGF